MASSISAPVRPFFNRNFLRSSSDDAWTFGCVRNCTALETWSSRTAPPSSPVEVGEVGALEPSEKTPGAGIAAGAIATVPFTPASDDIAFYEHYEHSPAQALCVSLISNRDVTGKEKIQGGWNMDEADGFEDEVLCVIVTCRSADGVENVLLSRYYDKISPVAQVTSIEWAKGLAMEYGRHEQEYCNRITVIANAASYIYYVHSVIRIIITHTHTHNTHARTHTHTTLTHSLSR
jgi:hypothetical protein